MTTTTLSRRSGLVGFILAALGRRGLARDERQFAELNALGLSPHMRRDLGLEDMTSIHRTKP
jgi:hypothetical protein